MGARIAKEDQAYLQSGADKEIYSDFSNIFLPHPITGQITRKVNINSVEQALRNLILTNKYERLRNPEFGSNIRNMLFELIDNTHEDIIKADLKYLIKKYEPRVSILDIKVSVNEEQYAINITITYNTITVSTPQSLNLTLYRVR